MNSTILEKPARKRKVKSISFRFFQDDATGEWGVTHHNTCNENFGGDAFNAFWDGMGIFHDVFEHSHEHETYFKGEYAMNVGGEMAAMGACWYYFDGLGVYNRLQNTFHAPDSMVRDTTLNMVQEAIENGYCQFGDRLRSNVPSQEEVGNSGLEWIIESFSEKVAACEPEGRDEQEVEFGREYKESCTPQAIADLHRYGYRMAEKLVPNTYENQRVLVEFRETWDKFCKQNSAEEMANQYRGFDLSLYRTKDGDISWKAVFVGHPGDAYFEPLTLRG